MKAADWKALYPFTSHFMATAEGYRLHYVDEGRGRPVVMLHGNPTWSFMYRTLIKEMSAAGGRAIAVDNLGMGLSEKPQNWPYRLQGHIDNLTRLIDEELRLPEVDLVMHDWGGAIGMGYAVAHPEKVRRLVLMNTAAYRADAYPRKVALAKAPFLGAFLVRGLNLFVEGALRLAAARPLPPEVKAGYRAPYDSWRNRIGTQRYVQDLPMTPTHPTWPLLVSIEERLPLLAEKPILLCWGERDFCFPMKFYRRWREIYPKARAVSLPEASHYLLEDAPEKVIPLLKDFLTEEDAHVL